MIAFALYDTQIGWAALAWTGAGVRGASLPYPGREQAMAWAKRRFPEAVAAEPEGEIAAAVAGLKRLFAGENSDLAHVRLDLEGVGAFEQAVYAAARAIPRGRTRTYGELAREIGQPGAARAVGRALGANPYPPIVPCHRILAAGGGKGGFSAPGGTATKMRLLEIEGALAPETLPLFGG